MRRKTEEHRRATGSFSHVEFREEESGPYSRKKTNSQKNKHLRLLMNTRLASGEITGLLALANKKCSCLPVELEACNQDLCCLPFYLLFTYFW